MKTKNPFSFRPLNLNTFNSIDNSQSFRTEALRFIDQCRLFRTNALVMTSSVLALRIFTTFIRLSLGLIAYTCNYVNLAMYIMQLMINQKPYSQQHIRQYPNKDHSNRQKNPQHNRNSYRCRLKLSDCRYIHNLKWCYYILR